MLKHEEMSIPNSCWNKAKENERLFVMLARDAAAPETIRFWVEERQKLGLNKASDVQIMEAMIAADLMETDRDGIREQLSNKE
jgi:hypothetical protein